VARRNTGKVRYESMSQYQQRKHDKRKKFGAKRKDGLDWTDKLFAKLKEAETDE
jgi:hypothetical protein